MSLIGETSASEWVQAASDCNPDDLPDIGDQLAVVRDRDPLLADSIQRDVTATVLARVIQGSVVLELAHRYFETIPGYTEVN